VEQHHAVHAVIEVLIGRGFAALGGKTAPTRVEEPEAGRKGVLRFFSTASQFFAVICYLHPLSDLSMVRKFVFWSFFTVALVGLFVLSGCSGSKPVSVQGKIVLPKDMKLDDTDTINVGFAGEGEKASNTAMIVNTKELTFTSTQVAPGKYKVIVRLGPYPGSKDSDKRARAFDPFNKAHDNDATKLSVEVTSEPTQAFTLDLGKNAITKN